MDPDISLNSIYTEVNKLSDRDAKKFSEAVQTALTVCQSAAPNTRLKLIETPTNNFMLVTNVIPTDLKKEKKDSMLNIDTALDKLASSFKKPSPKRASKSYLLQNIMNTTTEGIALSGSYIIYTKKHIETAYLLDKTNFIQNILLYAETPGILGHVDVRDLECFLWLAFCGPMSFCKVDNCFGYSKNGYNAPFPVLFPPCIYEKEINHNSFFGLLQIYVLSMYKDFNVEESNLKQKIKKRVTSVIMDLKSREKFFEEEIASFHIAAQMCLFCAIYKQNRLCMEYAANNLKMAVFSPIILKDCSFVQTTVTITQILPGCKGAVIFPVYDIGKLLSALVFSENCVTLKI
ncbi:protein UL95 [macacine betaherpesvirus 9]|uniref:Protein UL95 n=1 Tax=macacine betaherpesvirus 9 TaxID=2560568 RepID=A0A192XP13_9BETA|nr:protein UL95 [macacine betaherpesvirus 9]ANC96561.1 protein UL95 [macacine betaherpesvirus 9]